MVFAQITINLDNHNVSVRFPHFFMSSLRPCWRRHRRRSNNERHNALCEVLTFVEHVVYGHSPTLQRWFSKQENSFAQLPTPFITCVCETGWGLASNDWAANIYLVCGEAEKKLYVGEWVNCEVVRGEVEGWCVCDDTTTVERGVYFKRLEEGESIWWTQMSPSVIVV